MKERKGRVLTIVEVLQTVNDGGALEDLNQAIKDVTEKAIENCGKGSVTLKISIEHKGAAASRRVDINHAITKSEPKRVDAGSTFYMNESRQLTRNDPDQFTFDESDSSVE